MYTLHPYLRCVHTEREASSSCKCILMRSLVTPHPENDTQDLYTDSGVGNIFFFLNSLASADEVGPVNLRNVLVIDQDLLRF